LTAQSAVFTTHCATVFIKPIHPGVHPVIPTPAPSVSALAIIVRDHKNDIHVFNKYHAVDKAVKRVIQRLIPEKFYKSLISRLIGFSKVTSLAILTHLISEYSELDDDTIQDIDKNMKITINGETLFEELIEQIKWNQEYVAVQNHYTLKQIVSMAVDNVNNACLYIQVCRKWDRKTATQKTWANFTVYFVRAFKDTCECAKTIQAGGYVANIDQANSRTEMFSETQQLHFLCQSIPILKSSC